MRNHRLLQNNLDPTKDEASQNNKQNQLIINQIRIPKITNLFYISSKSLIIGVLEGEWQCWNLNEGNLILNQDIKSKLNLQNYKLQHCFQIEQEQKIVVWDFSLNILLQYLVLNFSKILQIQLSSNISHLSKIDITPDKNQIFIISALQQKIHMNQFSIIRINRFKRALKCNIKKYIWYKLIKDERYIIIKSFYNSYIMTNQNLKIVRRVDFRIDACNRRKLLTLSNNKIELRDLCCIKPKQELIPLRKDQPITAQIVNSYLILLYVKFIECYNIDNLELTHNQTVQSCLLKSPKYYQFSSHNNQIFIFIEHNSVEEMEEMNNEVIQYQ